MTSNLGSSIIQANSEKINEKNRGEIMEKNKTEVFELLKNTIRPEFLNRIDEIIMFAPLSPKDVRNIVELQFEGIQKMLLENNIKLNATEYALEWIANAGYDPQFGARPVKRVIQKYILNELSKQLLGGKIVKDTEILLDVFDNHVVFRNPQKEKKTKREKA